MSRRPRGFGMAVGDISSTRLSSSRQVARVRLFLVCVALMTRGVYLEKGYTSHSSTIMWRISLRKRSLLWRRGEGGGRGDRGDGTCIESRVHRSMDSIIANRSLRI